MNKTGKREKKSSQKKNATAECTKPWKAKVQLSPGDMSHHVSCAGGETVQAIVGQVIAEKKRRPAKDRKYYLCKKVDPSTKMSSLRQELDCGYHLYSPGISSSSSNDNKPDQEIPVPSRENETNTNSDASRKRKRSGPNVSMFFGKEYCGKDKLFDYQGIKKSLDAMITINQNNAPGGVANNSGEIINLVNGSLAKFQGDKVVSRNALLKEFESKIGKLYPDDQRKFLQIIDDVLLYESSDRAAFVLEQYVYLRYFAPLLSCAH
jgi:hypothetical protein